MGLQILDALNATSCTSSIPSSSMSSSSTLSFESFSGSVVESMSSITSLEIKQADDLLDSSHAFQPPDTSAARAPCPALNSLANHGYLPRDGRNITASELSKALQRPDAYNLSEHLADLLAYGGVAMIHRSPLARISLYDLARHGCIEHDASLVHKNTPEGHEYAPVECDTELLEGLLGNQDYLTLDAVAERREMVERASRYSLGSVHQEIARGEWALVLDVFGRKHGGKVPSDFLRVWLKENRIPEDWRPTHEQGSPETFKISLGIHMKMAEYRKKADELVRNCDSQEMRKEREVSAALTTTPEALIGEVRGRDSYSASPRPAKRQKTLLDVDV